MTNYHGLPHKGLHKDRGKRGDRHVGKKHLRLLSARKGVQDDGLKEKEEILRVAQNDQRKEGIVTSPSAPHDDYKGCRLFLCLSLFQLFESQEHLSECQVMQV